MAEITLARTGGLLRTLFQILLEHPEGLPAREALAKLRAQVKLTEWEKGQFASGQPRFDQVVRFATVDVGKAGWLLKQNGQWTVTEEGQKALHGFSDPKEFYQRARELYAEWRHGKLDLTSKEKAASEDEVEKAPEITLEQAQEQARNEIEQYLLRMPPYEFQELVASLLKAMGYHIAKVAPKGKDGGIDILAWGDPLGTRPPRIKVQVKRIGQNVSVEALRSFIGLLGNDEIGLFVTTSGFTKDAREEAMSKTERKVTLVDLESLFALWIEHYDQLDEAARRRLPLQPVYFLAPGP